MFPDSSQVEKTAQHIQDQFGHMDILVNNAGIAHFALFLEMSDEQRDRLFQSEFYGGLELLPRHTPCHDPTGIRPHRQRIFGNGPQGGHAGIDSLFSHQRGHFSPHPIIGSGSRRQRHYRKRDFTRLHRYSADKADGG